MTSEQRFASKPDMMEIVEVDLRSMCRICGLSKDNLIPIFEDEGLRNELHEKIIKYLPIIEVTIEDVLSISVCVQCTNVLLFWHELYTNCLQTDLKLKEMVQFHKDFEKMEQAAVETDEHLELEVQDLQEENEHLEQEEVTENPKDGMLSDHVYEDEEYVEEQELEENESENFVEAEEIPEKSAIDIQTLKDHENDDPLKIETCEERNHICPECNVVFRYQSELQSHQSSHDHDDKGSQISHNCLICGKIFGRKYNMEVHLSNHTEAQDNCCKICCLSFTTPIGLGKHKSIHTDEEMRNYDTYRSIVKCEICGDTFHSMFKLCDHKDSIHFKIKYFNCKNCNKQFRNKMHLKAHEKIHFEEFKCLQCGKELSSKKQLQEHERIHSDLRPYKCEICNLTFRTRSNAIQHGHIHTKIKEYKCTTCSSVFSRSNTLKVHMLIHTNEKPFHCNYCSMKFNQSSIKFRHTQRMHKICGVCKMVVGDKRAIELHKWKEHTILGV